MSARPLLLALAASLLTLACGPSLRRVHRASTYFEQCYAADLDPAVPDSDRRSCWQAWSRGYLVGASAERLDYVHERLTMLDPDRAAAISLATGDDGSIETIDTTDTTQSVGDRPPEEAVTAEPPPTPEPQVVPTDAARQPIPSEAVPTDDIARRQRAEERHERARERHLHRGFVAPSSLTPRCPCEQGWQTCAASCLADERGCIGACRREFSLCSRSCY